MDSVPNQAAAKVIGDFAKLLAAEPDEAARSALLRRARVTAMNQASEESFDGPSPLAFDLDSEPPHPRYVVVGRLERGQLGMLSADTGAAKSIVSQHLAVQAVAGLDWLGHETRAERVLYIDEENPRGTVERRLKALGLQADELSARLAYYSRKGLAIGDGAATDEWLEDRCRAFQPDLVIIDTLMAATAVSETNDNGQAVKLMKHLRGLAERFDAGVLVLHHERKKSKDYPNSSGQAMMGARQWAGQADVQMTLTTLSELEVTDYGAQLPEDAHAADLLADGRVCRTASRGLRRTFRWLPAEKDREGEPNYPELIVVTSEKDVENSLLWMLVENEGRITSADPTELELLTISIGTFVQAQEGEIKTADVAKGVARNPGDSSFKRALKDAVAADYIKKGAKQGRYAAGRVQVLDV